MIEHGFNGLDGSKRIGFLFGNRLEVKGMLHGDVTEKIIQAFYTVYNVLGCGFLEKVYENAMRIELERMICTAMYYIFGSTPFRWRSSGSAIPRCGTGRLWSVPAIHPGPSFTRPLLKPAPKGCLRISL